MRVLLLGPEKRHGGVGGVLSGLHDALLDEGVYVEYHFIRKERKWMDLFRCLGKFYFGKFNVINVHSGNIFGYFLWFFLLPVRKNKYIFTLHGHPKYEKSVKPWKANLYSFLLSCSMRGAVNRSCVSIMLSKYFDLDSFITPNALSSDILLKFQDMNFSQKEGVVCIADIRWCKGVDEMLSMLCMLDANKPRINIYGDFQDAYLNVVDKVEQYNCLGGEANLFAKKNHLEVCDILNKSSICIIPSRFDSFNMVVLEALAAGNVVICNSRVGASYLIEQGVNGFVYNNETEFIECLEQVLIEDDLTNLRKNAMNSAAVHTWKHEVKCYLEVYAKISS